MYSRGRTNFNRKRKYPYSSKKSSGRFKRNANNAKSYFTYDAPRAKSISRLNAALGAELKQAFHAGTISSSTMNKGVMDAHHATPFDIDPVDDTKFPATMIMQRIRQGSAYNNRIGDKVTVKSIDFRMFLRWQNPAFAVVEDVAIWILHDRSPNGIGPKYDDIFHNDDHPTTLDQKHMKNENRFTILKTFYIPCNKAAGANVQSSGVNKFLYYKYKKPTQVRYQADSATAAAVVENQFYIVACSPSVAVADNGPFALHYSVNIRYYDS